MSGPVPTTASLSDIYPEEALPAQQKRWTNLLSAFKSRYGKPAEYVSRSPGRVNCIGEHIDYSLYEVVPMAVTQDVLLAVALSPANGSPKVRIANLEDAKFPSREFAVQADGEVEIDSKVLEWTNYFKAGMRGATELLKKQGKSGVGQISMDILATGSVPAGGGMSSSAAFVCASALSVMKASGEDTVDKKDLVETAIVSERSVGVNSGGMDQAASVFGEAGSALYVSFLPELSARPMSFPKTHTPLTFLVAQSLVAADKHVAAPEQYNLRVTECTLAALVLAKVTGVSSDLAQDAGPLGYSLRGFHNAFFTKKDTETKGQKAQLEKLVKLVDDYLPQEEGYSREEMSDILGTSIDDLEQKYMTKFPVRADRFKLQQRATHVYTEALRVLNFKELLESETPKSEEDSEDLLRGLGGLLNETQDSCRDVYECSCPELDELCQLARSAGAYGSRLTGAGWGGCSVHLVPQDKVEKVKQKWTEKYYKPRFPDMTDERLAEVIVASKPGSGSYLFDVKGRESV